AQCDTIRLRLLKLGAVVRVSVRRVWVALSEAYPLRAVFAQVWAHLRALRGPRVPAPAGAGWPRPGGGGAAGIGRGARAGGAARRRVLDGRTTGEGPGDGPFAPSRGRSGPFPHSCGGSSAPTHALHPLSRRPVRAGEKCGLAGATAWPGPPVTSPCWRSWRRST